MLIESRASGKAEEELGPKMAAVVEEARERNEEGSVLLNEEARWAAVAEGVLLVKRRCSRRGWRLERQCSGRGCWLTRKAVVEEAAASVMEPEVVAGPLLEAAGVVPEEETEHQMRAGEARTWVVEVELKEAPRSE